MVVTGAVLILIGTINSFTNGNPLKPTEIIVEKHISPAFDKLTSLDLQPDFPPFISNFMQHGTNVFFKPQFMLSPTYVAGQEMIMENKEDCKKWPMIPAIPFAARPPMLIDEPVKVVETVVSDSQPPAIDKVIMINPSAPLIPELSISPMFISPVQEPEVDLPTSSPVIFSETPALPPLPIVPVPLETVDVKPGMIPSAPELPPLEIPQAPLILDEPIEVLKPTFIEEIKPVLIPESPELPTLPILPETETKPEPVPYVEVYESNMPLQIPEAPKLPPYSPPPLPVPVILSESVKECDKPVLVESPTIVPSQPPVIEEIESIIISQPQVLSTPAVSLTDIIIPQPAPESITEDMRPVDIPAAPVISELEESKVPLLVEDTKPAVPITIPSPPELPPISIPDLPISVVVPEPIAVPQFDEPLLVEPMPAPVEEAIVKPMEIPAAPVLPPMESMSFPIAPVPFIAQTTSLYNTIEQEILSNEIPIVEISNPVVIPEAPLLPPVPEIPVPIEEVSVPNEETKPVVKPLDIPAAPELPPLSFPSVPLEEPMIGLYPSAEFTSMVVETPKLPYLEVSKPPLFMPAPVHFPMMIPQMGMVHKSSSLSQVESIMSFPTSCVKNIVIERILPNIAKEGIEVVSSPSPNYPVLSPFQPTIGIRLY